MKRFLLCTDLDRTLIPNGKAPVSPSAGARFKRLAEREEVTLAYVTGRHRELIEQAIAEYDLPLPDFAIADVGTSIYRIDPSGWSHWAAWDTHIGRDWRGLSHDDVYGLLGDVPGLRLQEAEKQNLHKLSFYVPLGTDPAALIAGLDARLKADRIKSNLVWSADEMAGTGLLDILPASAGKLQAIRFLMGKLNFQPGDAVFAGDSGNDLDVLHSEIPAVLVANADNEIKHRVRHADPDKLYIARGGYLDMNGNYSAGILEGVAHYFPEVDAFLRGLS